MNEQNKTTDGLKPRKNYTAEASIYKPEGGGVYLEKKDIISTCYTMIGITMADIPVDDVEADILIKALDVLSKYSNLYDIHKDDERR